MKCLQEQTKSTLKSHSEYNASKKLIQPFFSLGKTIDQWLRTCRSRVNSWHLQLSSNIEKDPCLKTWSASYIKTKPWTKWTNDLKGNLYAYMCTKRVGWLVGSFVRSFIHLLVDSLVRWLGGWVAGWFLRLLVGTRDVRFRFGQILSRTGSGRINSATKAPSAETIQRLLR